LGINKISIGFQAVRVGNCRRYPKKGEQQLSPNQYQKKYNTSAI